VLGVGVIFRGNGGQIRVHLNSCHAGYTFFLSCLVWTYVPLLSGLPSMSAPKTISSRFLRIASVGYFLVAGLVLPLLWIIFEFASFPFLLFSYPSDLPSSLWVHSLQYIVGFSVGVAAVVLFVKIGQFIHFCRTEKHLDLAVLYSFVCAPNVLLRGIDILIGFFALSTFVLKSVFSDLVVYNLNFQVLATYFLSLIIAALVLPIELSGVALSRAPRWLRAVFASVLLCFCAIPLLGFEREPCLGDQSPYTMAQLDFLESCARLGSLYINSKTAAEESMVFEATDVDDISFLSNAVVKAISFPSIRILECSTFQISNNSNLQEINLEKLDETKNNSFTVSGNPSLMSLDFPVLTSLSWPLSSLEISKNENLASVTFTALPSLNGRLILSNNDHLVEINLMKLKSLDYNGLYITDNLILEKVELLEPEFLRSFRSHCHYGQPKLAES